MRSLGPSLRCLEWGPVVGVKIASRTPRSLSHWRSGTFDCPTVQRFLLFHHSDIEHLQKKRALGILLPFCDTDNRTIGDSLWIRQRPRTCLANGKRSRTTSSTHTTHQKTLCQPALSPHSCHLGSRYCRVPLRSKSYIVTPGRTQCRLHGLSSLSQAT
jgi:hypothetical protein